MKLLKNLLNSFSITVLIAAVLFSCSSDDSSDNNDDSGGNSYVNYTVSGPVVNGDFSIDNENSMETVSMIGTYYSQESVITVVMFDSQNNNEFALVLPAETGSWEFNYGNTDNNDVFLIVPDTGTLETVLVTATISEIQINENESLSIALQKVRGTFSGTFELTYDNNGQEETAIHNVSGDFEYNLLN